MPTGIAGTNVDAEGLIWDTSLPNVSAHYKELGVRGSDRIKHLTGGFRTVQIPTAQVLKLNTNPVQLVPAAGAGTLIVPTLLVATMVYNTTTYACNASGATLFYGANAGGTSTGFTITQAFIQSSSGTNAQVVVTASSAAFVPASTDFNQPLTLLAATSDPTTGNSDLYVRVYFYILSGLPFTNPAAVGL